ncbi:hypothetical protein TR13x_10300 [Caloranaerobacter sp. TR13]|uniref:hypothetical protein n=1 Tax=Caloranaerobacter sp. TR13 TaxID=1302151 RepID=UPI0006D3B37F|nr:hypothetical protein [Caloranaerobacter sp. TR13]KPU26400.1 hypothetical protein TR13x_10300 [Caloranaerobacter sp. TR13]
MIMFIITIIVYVFFVYGVVVFIKNLYVDYVCRYVDKRNTTIKVLVENEADVGYLLDTLKDDFDRIIFVLKEENDEIIKAIEAISKDYNVDYEVLVNIENIEEVTD